MQVEQALSEAIELRQKLADEADRLADEMAELDVEIRGLRAALARFGHPSPGVDVPKPLADLPRTEAIELVLSEATGPRSPKQVTEDLSARGRTDDYNSVSAAMAHLSRTERIHSVGRGQWLIGPSPQVAPDEAVVHQEDEIDT